MAFSYCFFAAEAYICRGSLSWATGHLQSFLGCFPQGWGCGWEKHRRCCPSHPWQAGDLPPRQPSWVFSALLRLPGLTRSLLAGSLLSRQGLLSR